MKMAIKIIARYTPQYGSIRVFYLPRCLKTIFIFIFIFTFMFVFVLAFLFILAEGWGACKVPHPSGNEIDFLINT